MSQRKKKTIDKNTDTHKEIMQNSHMILWYGSIYFVGFFFCLLFCVLRHRLFSFFSLFRIFIPHCDSHFVSLLFHWCVYVCVASEYFDSLLCVKRLCCTANTSICIIEATSKQFIYQKIINSNKWMMNEKSKTWI